MSNAIKAIVGIVLYYEGAALSLAGAPEIGVPMMYAGEALLLNAAVAQWLTKSPAAAPLTGTAINYSGTLEPRRIIYGRLKVGGINCMPPFTSGANNDYIHQVLAFAGHPIDGFEDVYFNQTRIPNADIQAITRTTADGSLLGISGYQGKAWIRRYDGTQTQADYILPTIFDSWDTTHIGLGIAYAALQMQYDQTVYSAGFPQATFVLRGKHIYDPRLDSTNGGSGTQRYADPTTWTYSTNPALCLRDYLTSALGLGESNSRINDTLVAAAANICDQTCTVPIPVLTGLTNWTNGTGVVTGVNTQFLSVLSTGMYVRAPNGTMYQISSYTMTDTAFGITVTYPGATANGQITQYAATNTTTATQKRYTCNVLLDCTATYQTNIQTLSGAMMGHCLYAAGKWLMYAGAWTGSAFTLGVDDIIGTVSTQAGTPRANLYNAVRGSFIDPQSNYQAVEFPPILDASYAADDGETIYVETSFPACVDLYEAQRNAILWNRFGRNQWAVTAQFGMSAYGVKVWETGVVTIPELGWNGQTVRCTGWKFDPRGIIELTLQEAYAADWTDPIAASDYVIKGVNVGPAAGRYVPYPPSGLTVTAVPAGLSFKVTLPAQVIPGTTIELLQYSASTPVTSAAVIAQANADTFSLPQADTTQRYYWVRTRGPNGQVSVPYPAVTGVAGAALAPSNAWITVNTDINGGAAIKTASARTTAWDASVYTLQSHDPCHISGKPTYAGGSTIRFMLGLSNTPSASPSYTNIDYGWYCISAGWTIYESGVAVGSAYSVPTVEDLVAIDYDKTSGTVHYYLNGILKHTTAGTAGQDQFGMVAFYDPFAAVNSLEYGPTTNIAITDTAQLNLDAVSQILTVYDSVGIDGISTGAYQGGPQPEGQNAPGSHITITTKGGPVAVDCSVGNLKVFVGAGTTTWGLRASVARDNTVIATCPLLAWDAANLPWTAGAYCLGIPCAWTFVDSQPAGTYDYALHMTIYSTSNTISNRTGVVYSEVTMKLREIKR